MEEQEVPHAIKNIVQKRELAMRLMEGKEIDKNEAKAIGLLEECVAAGDTDAMLMLARCCTLGHGTECDTERAETLLSEAAKKGNQEARSLIELIDDCKGQQHMDLDSLFDFHRTMKCASSSFHNN